MLRKLFASPDLSGQLVFKGGTSLSKVHHLIERFSEDIDLVLNWNLLGYGDDGDDPWEDHDSNSAQDRFSKEFNRRAQSYISEQLLPLLQNLFSCVSTVQPVVSTREVQVIDIAYPTAFSLDTLRPMVKLEIGPLASWEPSSQYTIRPYAAETFESVFENADCPVIAISAERTFWEKATILHQQAFRTSRMPPNYSRHYYDLHQLAGSPVKDNALNDLTLLAHVVKFKQRFYRSGWARYEEAKPGTFRLSPTNDRGRELKDDYNKMREMIFGSAPPWDAILQTVSDLESEINDLAPDTES